MKTHAIISIFIPHRGCKNECVFCNQRVITARDGSISPDGARKIINAHLATLQGRGLKTIEVSFFGGSFTGLPMEEQSAFLQVAKEYKDSGLVDKIHLSTRPDYIDKNILDNLKKYSVDVIELGVQSFSPEVLLTSRRGHSAECVYAACELIKEYGFELGIQLMVGLPGDNYERCMQSAGEAIKIGPHLARIYPTVVISGTKLFEMYKAGEYKPFSQEETLRTVKDMYKMLCASGINVMRVGLKSTALMNADSDFVACGYHPAFRQLVESDIAKDILLEKAEGLLAEDGCENIKTVRVSAPAEIISSVSGHNASNKKLLQEKWPEVKWIFSALPEGAEAEEFSKSPFERIEVRDATKRTAYISEEAEGELFDYLSAQGCKLIKVRPHANVDPAICRHPDVYMCSLGSELFMGDAKKLGPKYPEDVLYNAARVGKYFVCSKYVDSALLARAKELGLAPVFVPQGYVKCNLAVLDGRHVITEDAGIAKALEKTEIEVLLISPGRVSLPGYANGFVGGWCGRVGNEMVFHGDISKHPDFARIEAFVEGCGLGLRYFDFELRDIGSIIIA